MPKPSSFKKVVVSSIEEIKNGLLHPDDEVIIRIGNEQGEDRRITLIANFRAKSLRRVISFAITAIGLSWGGRYMGFF